MVDIVSLIIVIVLAIALVITNIYVLAYYCHPEDKGNCIGYVLKVIVVLGLTLAWAQVLILPLDVSNVRTYGIGFNMKLLWYILYIATIAYVLIIFPLSSSYYESDEEWTFCEKFRHSLCFFFISLVFFVGITLVLYFSIGTIQIPVTSIKMKNPTLSLLTFSDEPVPENTDLSGNWDINNKSTLELDCDMVVYAIAILCFLSWFVFAFFGGIGLAAIPLDLFHSFCTRPKSIKSSEVNLRKKYLIKNIEELKVLGEQVKDLEESGANRRMYFSSERRKYERKLHEFRAGFALASDEFHLVNAEREAMVKNNCVVLCYYLLLPIAIISLIITLVWLAQFVCSYFYTLKDNRAGYPLLSYVFLFFEDNNVGFLTYFLFTILSVYLLLCVIKGNFKFGVRILCCWTVHPMKKDGTYMNSFLFNVSLVLIGSCAITQFCADALSDYFSFTDVDLIFNVQVKYLRFFKYFYSYHVFQYMFFGFFILSFFYLILRPSDRIKPNLEKYEKESEMNLLN